MVAEDSLLYGLSEARRHRTQQRARALGLDVGFQFEQQRQAGQHRDRTTQRVRGHQASTHQRRTDREAGLLGERLRAQCVGELKDLAAEQVPQPVGVELDIAGVGHGGGPGRGEIAERRVEDGRTLAAAQQPHHPSGSRRPPENPIAQADFHRSTVRGAPGSLPLRRRQTGRAAWQTSRGLRPTSPKSPRLACAVVRRGPGPSAHGRRRWARGAHGARRPGPRRGAGADEYVATLRALSRMTENLA